MDTLTHSLCGLTLAQSGLKQLAPQATLTLLLGANLPDIDMVSTFGGAINYLKYHGGIAHSIVGVFLGALVLASLIYFINKHFSRQQPAVAWWRFFLIAGAALGSHLLLDLSSTDGVRLFSPFDSHRYSLDLVRTIDPCILACLILGLAVPFIARLVNQEIGAAAPKRSYGAILALILILGYLGAKEFSHRLAMVELRNMTFRDEAPIRMAVMPDQLSPFGWHGIVETETSFYLVLTGAFLAAPPVLNQKGKIYFKDPRFPILDAARQGPQCQLYLAVARFPLARVEETGLGFQVEWRDLWDELSGFRGSRFILTSQLNRQLKIESESIQM
jgi:inner membrane protein